MSADPSSPDPLEFMKNLWGSMGFAVPGMVTPTLDLGEIDKRIADLKAVENWMRMNLGMLQASIQGLEMQRATLAAMQAMNPATGSAEPAAANPFANPAQWPWNMMQPGAAAGDAPKGEAEKK